MKINVTIHPFNNCPALDGYHCQTNSLAKIYYHYNHPLSEDMLLGLGAGMGFIYWKMKMGLDTYVFIGGRGNNKEFFTDLGIRTGVQINTITTASAKKSETYLLEKLKKQEPTMVFGDMGFMPWFDLPKDYHFGGHTFVICGYDGENTVLISDIDQKASGIKRGFYYPATLKQLSIARGSKYKPFPPKNAYLEFDFSDFHQPTSEDIYSSIKQTIKSQLNPPIKNIGVKGIRHTAKEILKWPDYFNDNDLRMNLFTLYVFIEIGGTGGGCFRYMYSRFLQESAKITKNETLLDSSKKIQKSGEMFTEIALLFKDTEKMKDIDEKIKKSSMLFNNIADLEEDMFMELSRKIKL